MGVGESVVVLLLVGIGLWSGSEMIQLGVIIVGLQIAFASDSRNRLNQIERQLRKLRGEE